MLKVGNVISLHAFGLQPLWEAEVLPSRQIHQQQRQKRSSGTCKMAMTLFNNHCEPCSKGELDLESLPPVQVGIIDDYVVCTGPKSALSGTNPLEFEISASGDDYIDLSQCYLSLKCKVKNSDGTDLRTQTTDGDGNVTEGNQASVGPVNLFLHSLFRQVDVSFNDTLVSTSGDCYAYRAYITDLLSYGSDVKKTWLKRLEGWHEDQAGKYDDQSNTGLRERTKMISNSRSFDLKGRLHIDMLLQERLLPNNLAVKITLVRAEPQFSLMSFETTVNGYDIVIEEAVLEARKVRLAAEEQMRLEKVLAGPGAKYPITHAVTRHFTISSGTSTADLEALFMGQIPNKVVLGMISNDAFSGDWKKNPYRFQHFGLNSACLIVDGRHVPAQPMMPDFSKGLYAECYQSLMKACAQYPNDSSNGITADQYEDGSCFLAFDLTHDESGDGVNYTTPRRMGTVRASLRFANTLTETITVVAFGQYDNIVTIDKHRSVMFDYTAWEKPSATLCIKQNIPRHSVRNLMELIPVCRGGHQNRSI